MRRQTSLAIREQIQILTRQSLDSKPLSKIKKCKNGHALGAQKKTESRALKALETNQIKSGSNQFQKQQVNERWLKKLNMISKIVTKGLDNKHRQIYFKFIDCIQKEEKIRAKIEYQEQDCNRSKLRQFKDLLMRLLEKQEYLLEESNQYSTEIVNNASGAFVSNYLIAKQCSPKAKLQNLAFGDFNKKTSGLVHQEILKKELVIKRLFQKIETLKQTAHVVDKSRNISFSQNIDNFNTKIRQHLNNKSKMDQLQQNNKLIKQINDNYKSEEELLRYKYKMLESDYGQLLQKTSDYRQLKQLKLDYLRLKQMADDYPLLQKKYRELQEQFQVLVSEKIELQSDLFKKSNQIKMQQNRINELVSQLKLKITEISSEDLQQIKNIQANMKHKFTEELNALNQFIVQFITETIIKSNNNEKFIKDQLLLQQNNYSLLQNLTKNQQSQILELTQQKNLSIKSYENKFSLLKLDSSVYQHQNAFCYQQKRLTLISFQIFKSQTFKISKQKVRSRDFQIVQFEIINYFSKTKISDQLSQTQFLIKQEETVSTQTQNSPLNAQFQNKIKKIDNAFQTGKPILNILNVIHLIFDQHKCPPANPTNPKFQIAHVIQINLQNRCFQNCKKNSERKTEQNKIINVLQLNVLNIPQQTIHDQTLQTLQILEKAEACALISQASILRSQINCYRQEIDRLKLQIRQHQKEKQDENIFNFRL